MTSKSLEIQIFFVAKFTETEATHERKVSEISASNKYNKKKNSNYNKKKKKKVKVLLLYSSGILTN